MRLIRQSSLTFSRPNSTKIKVYEIDLCEIRTDQYVVNYRYGRKGHPLRDGTRTITPVRRAAADQEYDQLVQDKIQSGYIVVDSFDRGTPKTTTTPAPTPAPNKAVQTISPTQHSAPVQIQSARQHTLNPIWASDDALASSPDNSADAVLRWLSHHLDPSVDVGAGRWPLAQVAWRAGELRLEDAVTPLMMLLGRSHGEDYAIAWALGRCGGEQVVAPLEGLLPHPSPSVARIARAGLMVCLPDAARAEHAARIQANLPNPAQETLDALGEAAPDRDVIAALYLLGHSAPLRAWVRDVSLTTSEALGCVRTLLQLAEHSDDFATVAAVVARLEGSRLGTTASGARRIRGRGWRLLARLDKDDEPGVRVLGLALLGLFSDSAHPQASNPKRRLHTELGKAFEMLSPLSEAELLSLLAAPCGRVRELVVGVLEERLLSEVSLPALDALLRTQGVTRQLGVDVFGTVDGDLFERWAADQGELLAQMPALLGEAASHWDVRVRGAVRLLLAQVAPGMDGGAVASAILHAAGEPGRAYDAALDAVSFVSETFPAALRALPTPELVGLLRLGNSPLTPVVSTVLVDRDGIPVTSVVPMLCEGGEAGVLAGLRVLEASSDAVVGALSQLEQDLLLSRLRLLYGGPQEALRPRLLAQLARLLMLSGRLDGLTTTADKVAQP